jgi:soluble lytic murein transglycosylase-like protein
MKLRDILQTEQQLDEITLKQAVAAGMIGLSAMSPKHSADAPPPARVATSQAMMPAAIHQKDTDALLTATIVSRYNVAPNLAKQIVQVADKYQHDVFPTKEDILAVIGVESSFRPHARSGLRRDPALGLMQVRPRVWKVPPKKLLDVEQNIKHGSAILRKYYDRLQDKDAAFQAYNVGITAFRRGEVNQQYVSKVNAELERFADL